MVNFNKIIASRTTKRDTTTFTRPSGAGNFDNMDDKNIVDQINIKRGTVDLTPTNPKDIANKAYVDAGGGGAPEGTAVLSTGELGANKFLREDGDGTSSWQTPAGSGDVTAAANLTDVTIVQGDGGAKGVKTSTATVTQISDNVTHSIGDGSDHADVASNTTHRGITTGNPHVVLLDELGNPSSNATFSMSNKSLIFNYTNPSSSDGALELNASGAFTGDLLHVHQHTGNPGVTNLIHLECEDADVTPIRVNGIDQLMILSDAGGDIFFVDGSGITVTGDIIVTGTVDGIDIATDVAANTSASHTQNTDTALGSGAEAADHGTAATDQIVNIAYGTGSPPTANTTTIGSLFVKYTA